MSNASALQAARIGSTALFGMTPVAASARASAASKSSMFCKVAASSQTARMAALDSIGASRGERAVLMARDLTILVRSCQSKSAALRGCEYASPSFGGRPFFWPWRALLGKDNATLTREVTMAMTMNGEVQLAATRQAVWD